MVNGFTSYINADLKPLHGVHHALLHSIPRIWSARCSCDVAIGSVKGIQRLWTMMQSKGCAASNCKYRRHITVEIGPDKDCSSFSVMIVW